MASLSPGALRKALAARPPAPIYYVHGPEEVLKDETVQQLLDAALDPASRDFNLDIRSAQQLDPEQVVDLCNQLPMLAERRVVLLRDIEAWRRKTRGKTAFLAYAANPAAETMVVLVQGGDEKPDADLAARSVSVLCDTLTPEKMAEWATARAAAMGITLGPDAATHLARAAGADGLGALRTELEKFASLPAGTPVTTALVEELVGVRSGETQYDWRDAVIADDTARALRLLRPVLAQAGVSAVPLLGLLGTTLVALQLVRARLDAGEPPARVTEQASVAFREAKAYRIGNFREVARHLVTCAPRWPAPRVRVALRAALEADQALKGTTIGGEVAVLELLILRLAGERRVAA
ncbi:MAG: DNA polymerase III subunit delta [Gemmatimonadales bacterium]|nr:DNA polymerase III subunit delta [Gemmatimonadales bacterium]